MEKPHAICIPYPAQGHINPMMKLAKLLHFKGFHVSFVNNHYNHKRLLRSRGPSSLDGLPDFRFYSITDGLPPSDADSTQSIPDLCESVQKHCLEPFCELITRLNGANSGVPPVSCIVSDGVMSFTLEAAKKFGLPEVLLWTASGCGLLAYTHYRDLVQKGYTPLKDMSYVTNGYLETTIDWIPGMNNIRLRDFPSFIRTTDINDIMLNYFINECEALPRGSAVVLNTFDALEQDSVNILISSIPRIFTVGPLHMMEQQHLLDEQVKQVGSNLWKEDASCINWLDTKDPGSVVFVNFGSIAVLTQEQLIEFGWGLANSMKDFLWVTRPDIVGGNEGVMPPEFRVETEGRGMIASWCPQAQVLKHPAIGVFLTHSGWNSTIESISNGVPVLCWPFFAEQQTNCRYSCVEWGIGMEIDTNVKREEVEAQVREMIDGLKGKQMKAKALDLKKKAEEAVTIGGSSYCNFNKLVSDIKLKN